MNMKVRNVVRVVAKFILVILVTVSINIKGEVNMKIAQCTKHETKESLVEPTQLGPLDAVIPGKRLVTMND